MLADNLLEEFELKEDEPWYDPRDLQQDLQLAAQLGKTLLDRNTELEASLQQMCATNQEQLQEIEHLSKRVEHLRQVNEQHAKVYEQLDVTARELEETNQKLVADSRASQQKIQSLTETIECLQADVDRLQAQVEQLKASGRASSGSQGPWERSGAPGGSSLKELYDLRQHFVHDHVFAERVAALPGRARRDQEAGERLQRAVRALQAQLDLERQRRAALEEELGLALRETRELERQLGAADACRARALELEAEVAEARRALRAERPLASGLEKLGPAALLAPFGEPGRSLLEEMLQAAPEAPRRPLRRSRSESGLSGLAGGGLARGHEETCARRVRPKGVSLLDEVDTQYSALKAKYEELLRRCQQDGDSQSHKAVQTARAAARDPPARDPAAARAPEPAGSPSSPPSPEYKALFKEIFSCIQKTKQEIDEQRRKHRRALPSPS